MTPEDGARQAQDLLGRRAGEYVEIWESATAKMMNGAYRSEDLVEDWFAWWGRAARDMTAVYTLGFGSLANGAAPGMAADEQEESVADDR